MMVYSNYRCISFLYNSQENRELLSLWYAKKNKNIVLFLAGNLDLLF